MERQEAISETPKQSWLIGNAPLILGYGAFLIGERLDEWLPYHTGMALAFLAWSILTYWLPPKSTQSLLRWTIEHMLLVGLVMTFAYAFSLLLNRFLPTFLPSIFMIAMIMAVCLYQVYLFFKAIDE